MKIIKKRFSNDLLYNTTSQELYNNPLSSDQIKYIGAPPSDINAAWEKLFHAQYIALKNPKWIRYLRKTSHQYFTTENTTLWNSPCSTTCIV